MELTQAGNTIPDSPNITTAFGITPEMIFWSVLVVLAVAFIIYAAARYLERSNNNISSNNFQGVKGGKVKRTISEYMDEDNAERI